MTATARRDRGRAILRVLSRGGFTPCVKIIYFGVFRRSIFQCDNGRTGFSILTWCRLLKLHKTVQRLHRKLQSVLEQRSQLAARGRLHGESGGGAFRFTILLRTARKRQ
ncbi:hypothetical protein [Paraburkholderia lycopersici]|uniref:hypothetical protein n=1 Tax=Paraburkholderia lycopersici TaxID=416944 RepID=UPI001161130C|nr:hypothetical protein [Paraburkholderia lycopersici]